MIHVHLLSLPAAKLMFSVRPGGGGGGVGVSISLHYPIPPPRRTTGMLYGFLESFSFFCLGTLVGRRNDAQAACGLPPPPPPVDRQMPVKT